MADDNEINVKVTATTADLNSGLLSASKQVESFGDKINDLAQKAQKVNPDAFKELAGSLNAGKVDLDEFRDGLISITTAQSTAAQASVDLAEKSTITSGAMREFVVVGRELASGNFTRLPGSLSILAQRLGGIPPVAILATGAIAALGYAMYEAIDSSQRFEKELGDVQIALQASGRGGSYNESFVTGLIDKLRQAADVSRDEAAEIVRSFESIRTLGQSDVQAIIGVLRNYATATHESTEQAGKDLDKVFGGDTYAGIKRLDEQFNLLTPDQREAADAAHAVGDEMRLTTIAIGALNDLAKRVPAESLTGLERYFNDIKLSLSGVNIEAEHARNALLAAAEAADKVGNTSNARAFRDQAERYTSPTRNLPAYSSTPRSEPTGQNIDNSAAVAAKKAEDERNDAIKDGIALYDKGNSALREQESHVERISRLAKDLNAATTAGNAEAVQKINAQIEAENKQYDDRLKRQEPKAPRATTPDTQEADFQALINNESEKAAADQQKFAQTSIDADAKAAEERLATAKALVEQRAALGQIDNATQIQQLEQIAAQELAIEQNKYDQLASLHANDSTKQLQIAQERIEAEQKYDQQIIQLRTRAAQQNQRTDNTLTQSVTRGLNQTVDGVLQGTQTMGQAFQRLGTNIVLSVVNNALDKIVTQFISNNATIQAAQQALNSFLDISNEANSTDAIATSQVSSHAAIMAYAGEGAAAAIASTSAIPLVGPELAPAAGAAIYGDIMSYNIASAAGGMVVDSDQLAMVHENEMILPAHLSQGIGAMIANGQSGGNGVGHTFNNTFHVNAGEGLTAKQLPDMIVKTLTKAMRNGQFGAMRQ